MLYLQNLGILDSNDRTKLKKKLKEMKVLIEKERKKEEKEQKAREKQIKKQQGKKATAKC